MQAFHALSWDSACRSSGPSSPGRLCGGPPAVSQVLLLEEQVLELQLGLLYHLLYVSGHRPSGDGVAVEVEGEDEVPECLALAKPLELFSFMHIFFSFRFITTRFQISGGIRKLNLNNVYYSFTMTLVCFFLLLLPCMRHRPMSLLQQ